MAYLSSIIAEIPQFYIHSTSASLERSRKLFPAPIIVIIYNANHNIYPTKHQYDSNFISTNFSDLDSQTSLTAITWIVISIIFITTIISSAIPHFLIFCFHTQNVITIHQTYTCLHKHLPEWALTGVTKLYFFARLLTQRIKKADVIQSVITKNDELTTSKQLKKSKFKTFYPTPDFSHYVDFKLHPSTFPLLSLPENPSNSSNMTFSPTHSNQHEQIAHNTHDHDHIFPRHTRSISQSISSCITQDTLHSNPTHHSSILSLNTSYGSDSESSEHKCITHEHLESDGDGLCMGCGDCFDDIEESPNTPVQTNISMKTALFHGNSTAISLSKRIQTSDVNKGEIYFQDHALIQKNMIHLCGDNVKCDLHPSPTQHNRDVIVKKIIFIRHSQSFSNANKLYKKTLKTKWQRVLFHAKNVIYELFHLFSPQTHALDPTLCKKGVYQALKFQQWLQSFCTKEEQQLYNYPQIFGHLNNNDGCISSSKISNFIEELSHKSGGLLDLSCFQNSLQQFYKKRIQDGNNYLNLTPKQLEVISILNGNEYNTQNSNHGYNSPSLRKDNQHHSRNDNTLLISSTHRRTMLTLCTVMKHFLLKFPLQRVHLHSNLASFAPQCPNITPRVDLPDSLGLHHFIARDMNGNISNDICNNGKVTIPSQKDTSSSPPQFNHDDLFSAEYNTGMISLTTPGTAAIDAVVCDFIGKCPQKNIVIAGHSSWLLHCLRMYMPRDVNYIGKTKKLNNTTTVAFDVHFTKIKADYYDAILKDHRAKNDTNGENIALMTPIEHNQNNKSRDDTEKIVAMINPNTITTLYRGYDMSSAK